jgi:hypothetical protein
VHNFNLVIENETFIFVSFQTFQSPDMYLFNEYEASKFWSDFSSMPYTTSKDDPFFLSRQCLKDIGNGKMRRGPWVGLAFAYGGALGSYLRHRDKYLVTILFEELLKTPKEQIATLFEKLSLVITKSYLF